jgi:CRP/FNR family cyclic AMP-dependent transcriptional regulator
MATHRHSETLARCEVFNDLDEREIDRLNTQCVWRRFDAGTEILSHQDDTTDVYFVAAGTVRVIISSIRGRDTVFRDIDAGDYFGEIAAIDGKERSASIVAMTNATVAKMPARVFQDLAKRHGPVCYRILERAVRQIRYLSERINEFRTLDVRHRIYVELLRLARTPAAGGNKAVISPPPTHQEIADRISTRREAVARELKQLERDGLLGRRRGAFVITDIGTLAQKVEDAREGLEEEK